MVDQALSVLNPHGLTQLNDEQRKEVRRFINERIVSSDELLGAVVRKISDILKDQESEETQEPKVTEGCS